MRGNQHERQLLPGQAWVATSEREESDDGKPSSNFFLSLFPTCILAQLPTGYRSCQFSLGLVKYLNFLRKRMIHNPSRGPFHMRAPSRIFARTVRGMLPHKTPRGAAAMERLKVFEGVPPPHDKEHRMVVPEALRVLRLKPGRKFCTLKRLSTEMGWKYQETVEKLEAKRKVRSAEFYQAKKAKARAAAKVEAEAGEGMEVVKQTLADFGY